MRMDVDEPGVAGREVLQFVEVPPGTEPARIVLVEQTVELPDASIVYRRILKDGAVFHEFKADCHVMSRTWNGCGVAARPKRRHAQITTLDKPAKQLLAMWEATAPGSYIGWGKSTQLGYSLALAMGAKLAAPDKLCINVMGDAAIGMTGMDLETAARAGIAILTVVLNNGIMAAEREVLVVSDEKYGAMTVGGNYTRVAEGLGVRAERVETPDALIPALRRGIAATEAGAPYLVEAMVKEGQRFSRY